ncbi:MAG: PH domain-containing protein [Gammaproteobacteria bacterium]|nr:PH domain-containing protein [Gammaproteobacteria bacterium]
MDVFAISPAAAKPLWFIVPICAFLAIIIVALAYTAYSSRHSRVEISDDRLKLVGDFWGREIPRQLLNVSAARILDITKKSEFSPKRRTLGTGLPGYSSGWFRLRNGEKALVYLTQWREVVYLPTSDGYSLLLSVEQPQGFIETLQR